MGIAAGACVAGAAGLPSAFGADAAGGAAAQMATSLRLSPSQYRESIADIFDSSIKITGRFEPE